MTRQALNRALLARQGLLERRPVSALSVIEHLVGLQAQMPRPPFLGLQSRIAGFYAEELRDLIERREVVRVTAMRGTLHLMSAADYVAFRPVLQPMLTRGMQSILRDRVETFPWEPVLAEARRLFGERPRTFTEVRNGLVAAFPDADERAMGYAVRMQLPLVAVPAGGEWSFRADPAFTLAETWLGRPLGTETDPAALVLRYLAAFGPATLTDVQAWSGFSGLGPVLERLRPQLLTFRDERRRELFDLPDAPRPPEETPARVRFVADFDNLVLGHADRTRVIADAHRALVVTKNGLVLPTFLVDGFVAGTWKVARVRETAVVALSPFGPLSRDARDALAAEAEPLARFLEPGTTSFDLRLTD